MDVFVDSLDLLAILRLGLARFRYLSQSDSTEDIEQFWEIMA